MHKCYYCGANAESAEGCWRHKPRKPIRKSKKTQEKIDEETEEKERMWDMFIEIWNERPHRSEISGASLGMEPRTYMFDHAIEKSTHPEFKFNKKNIILCTGDEHTKKNNGFPLPAHKELIEQIKEELLN